LVALAVLLAVGCSSQQPPASSAGTVAQDLTGRPGNVYRVTYKPDTIVIGRATVLKALQSVSADERVLVFDESEPAMRAIAPGKVILLERIGLRTVSAVKRDGGYLAILTDPASLTDAIADGQIKWNIPVHFADLRTASVTGSGAIDSGWLTLIPRAEAAEGAGGRSLSGEKNGWKYQFSATPGSGRLDLALNMAKDVNGIKVSMDAGGYIPDFNSIASITIAQGAVSGMNLQNEHLSGEMNMTFSAATTGAPGGFGKKQVKLPAILKAPFFLGALPLTLEISSAITFTPGLGANHQLATAKFHMAYTDLTGFSFGGGSSGAKSAGGSDGDGDIVDAKGVTLAGIGIVAGISMPRLEFKLGTSSIVDALEKLLPTGLAEAFEKTFLGDVASKVLDVEESIKTEGAAHVQVVLVGSFLASGPISLISCDKTTFSFHADAGADASVFGKSVGDMSVDLFKKDIVKTNPPNINCG
jgi:hypothetical protein